MLCLSSLAILSLSLGAVSWALGSALPCHVTCSPCTALDLCDIRAVSLAAQCGQSKGLWFGLCIGEPIPTASRQRAVAHTAGCDAGAQRDATARSQRARPVPRLPAIPRQQQQPGERPLSARLRSSQQQQPARSADAEPRQLPGSPRTTRAGTAIGSAPASAPHSSMLSTDTPLCAGGALHPADAVMQLFAVDLQRRIARSGSEAATSSSSPAASTARKPVRSLSAALEAMAAEQSEGSRLRYGMGASAACAHKPARRPPA